MSHFTVLVIGENAEKQLAPFHEFECTGEDDEYVQDIDETEEARVSYSTHTERQYEDPQGNFYDPHDHKFYREPTEQELQEHGHNGRLFGSGCDDKISWDSDDWGDGKGYRAKIHFLPEGWKEIKKPVKDIKTFAQFIEDWYGRTVVPFGELPDLNKKHKYGYVLVDAKGEVTKVIRRTNPQKKWDWYQIGGRWNGFFKLKDGKTGTLGEGSALNSFDPNYKPPSSGSADVCYKRDIDVEAMRKDLAEKAAERYDKVHAIIDPLPQVISWEAVQAKHKTGPGEMDVDWEAARKEYNNQEAIKQLRNNKETCWEDLEDFQCSREEYIEEARMKAITTFAVIKDGKWWERGEMGWWGIVSGEKDKKSWSRQFNQMFDTLPDDTLLTIVDCHI